MPTAGQGENRQQAHLGALAVADRRIQVACQVKDQHESYTPVGSEHATQAGMQARAKTAAKLKDATVIQSAH
jgi:hypothetical protein